MNEARVRLYMWTLPFVSAAALVSQNPGYKYIFSNKKMKFHLYIIPLSITCAFGFSAYAAPSVTVTGSGGKGFPFMCEVDKCEINEYFTATGADKYLDKIISNLVKDQKFTLNLKVRNDSGSTWKDFHFEVIGLPKIGIIDSPPVTSVFNKFNITNDKFKLDFYDGSVSDDTSPAYADVTFSVAIVPSENGNLTLRQWPTTEGLICDETTHTCRPVPGPLPIFGAGAFFTFSRQIRKRIRKA